jgi:hypothetical protein
MSISPAVSASAFNLVPDEKIIGRIRVVGAGMFTGKKS